MPTKPPKPVQIGTALRIAREAAGLSQAEVGRMVGMSGGQLSQIESGRKKSPELATVAKLAAALHVSIDALVGRAPEIHLPAFPESARERLILRREITELRTQSQALTNRLDEIVTLLDAKPATQKKR